MSKDYGKYSSNPNSDRLIDSIKNQFNLNVNQTQYGYLYITLDNGQKVQFSPDESLNDVCKRIETFSWQNDRYKKLHESYEMHMDEAHWALKMEAFWKDMCKKAENKTNNILSENKADNLKDLKNINYDAFLLARNSQGEYDLAYDNKTDAVHAFWLNNDGARCDASAMKNSIWS